jgi:hypothetical protein
MCLIGVRSIVLNETTRTSIGHIVIGTETKMKINKDYTKFLVFRNSFVHDGRTAIRSSGRHRWGGKGDKLWSAAINHKRKLYEYWKENHWGSLEDA